METFYATEIIQQHKAGRPPGYLCGDRLSESIIGRLSSAVKFRLPENGLTLPESMFKAGACMKEAYLEYGNGQRLPFETVALEYRLSPDEEELALGGKMLVLASQEKEAENISIWAFSGCERSKAWTLCPMVASVDFNQDSHPILGASKEAEDFVSKNELKDVYLNEIHQARIRVAMFLVALGCSNVGFQDQPNTRKMINKKRQKKGKPPFYSYKVLTITPSKSSGGSDGASGRSPRVHLRRGHIRRLPNKTVWVNASVVGDKSKGLVAKDYTVPMRADLPDAANWPIHATQN